MREQQLHYAHEREGLLLGLAQRTTREQIQHEREVIFETMNNLVEGLRSARSIPWIKGTPVVWIADCIAWSIALFNDRRFWRHGKNAILWSRDMVLNIKAYIAGAITAAQMKERLEQLKKALRGRVDITKEKL